MTTTRKPGRPRKLSDPVESGNRPHPDKVSSAFKAIVGPDTHIIGASPLGMAVSPVVPIPNEPEDDNGAPGPLDAITASVLSSARGAEVIRTYTFGRSEVYNASVNIPDLAAVLDELATEGREVMAVYPVGDGTMTAVVVKPT